MRTVTAPITAVPRGHGTDPFQRAAGPGSGRRPPLSGEHQRLVHRAFHPRPRTSGRESRPSLPDDGQALREAMDRVRRERHEAGQGGVFLCGHRGWLLTGRYARRRRALCVPHPGPSPRLRASGGSTPRASVLAGRRRALGIPRRGPLPQPLARGESTPRASVLAGRQIRVSTRPCDQATSRFGIVAIHP